MNPNTIQGKADDLRAAYTEAARLKGSIRLYAVDGIRIVGGSNPLNPGAIVEHVMAEPVPVPGNPIDDGFEVVNVTVWGNRGRMFSLLLDLDAEVTYRID